MMGEGDKQGEGGGKQRSHRVRGAPSLFHAFFTDSDVKRDALKQSHDLLFGCNMTVK